MKLPRQLRQLSGISILSLLLVLSACGGGGSGSSSTSGSPPGESTPVPGTPTGSFSVSIDRNALSFSGEEDGSIAPQIVLGSGSGTLPPVIYLGSLDLGTAIQQVTVETVGMQVKFTVYPKSGLAPGEYSGSLQLFACPDEKCTTQFAGSPVNVPYKISIAKGFKLAHSGVSLAALSGATASASVGVQLRSGVTGFTTAVTTGGNWLSVSKQGADSFTVMGKAMPPGSYFGSVAVNSGGSTRTLSVDYTVTGDASTVTRIIPDVSSLSFTATATAAAPARTVNVTLPSWTNQLDAEIRYLSTQNDWLGLVKTGERSYSVSASASALQAGTYQAEVILRSDSVASVTIPVSFAVGAASWSISGPTRFEVTGDTTAAQLAGDLSVAMPSLPAQAYNASSNASWLKLSRTGGNTGGAPLRLSVDTAELVKLPNFRSHTAELTISAADTRIAPTKVTVTLDKALPELHFVSPNTRLPGEAGEYILRGRGLGGVAAIDQALRVSGATPTSLTRVSDTEVRVRLGGSSAGEVGFSLPNGLGTSTGAPMLRVVAPTAFPSAVIATSGNKSSLVYDAERQALYSVNKGLQSIMRFAWDGSGWVATSVPLPGADALALSPDGTSLVVTATTGHIVLLDPATLEKQGSYAAGAVGGDTLNSLPRLAVTNDGRAYFQGGTWGGLSYFDLATREFGSAGDGMRFSFYSGPWFSVSGDGSRLNIVQSGSITPTPPMLYMDSSDSTPKVNPAGLEFWYEAAQSLRGERFVQGTYKVWDRDWALIGNLALPSDHWFGRSPLVSPDGTRVYVMAYPSSYTYGADMPRVYVFDSSTRMVSSTNLPLLGYFDLADYPTCRSGAYGCDTRALGAISPDGKTLFFIGDAKLVVAPVPATLTLSPQRAAMQRASSSMSGVRPQMTRLPTRQ